MISDIANIELEKHFVSTSSSAVDEIISPLKVYGISHLSLSILRDHDKKGGTIEFLSSDPRMLQPYIDNKVYKEFLGAGCQNYIDCAVLSKTVEETSPLLAQLATIQGESYKFGNGIDVIQTFEDRCEVYYFASDIDRHHMQEFYLNNIDFLRQFIFLFREKAKVLFNKSREYRLYCSGGGDDTMLTSDYWQSRTNKANIADLYNLTKKERECAGCIKFGYGAKEIAVMMNISKKTVEKHVAQIKRKMHCKTIYELLLRLQ